MAERGELMIGCNYFTEGKYTVNTGRLLEIMDSLPGCVRGRGSGVRKGDADPGGGGSR